MDIKDFTDLEIWQEAHKLVKEIYKITSGFPTEEKYGITSQLRRCASSVPANIVEGFERENIKEYIHFLNIAKGSISETRYFLILSQELGYIERDKFQNLEKLCIKIRNYLGALINKLKQTHRGN